MAADLALQTWLSRQVRASMKALDIKQTELARDAGVSEKHLSRVLNGREPGSIVLWDELLYRCGLHECLRRSAAFAGDGEAAT